MTVYISIPLIELSLTETIEYNYIISNETDISITVKESLRVTNKLI